MPNCLKIVIPPNLDLGIVESSFEHNLSRTFNNFKEYDTSSL